jgi:spore coat polysaccharide biosynthesis protein SpsF (cytidylyltransferase family)
MNIGIIIQARTGSTRLPNKMILPFWHDKGILEVIIERLIGADFGLPIILATTTNSNDDIIEQIGSRFSIKVYRGNELNVLNRFVCAAETFNIQKIIRICADNPFIDINSIRILISEFIKNDVDYWCYSTSKCIPTIKTHYGFWPEGVSYAALKKIVELSSDIMFQEHVTNYIYTNPNGFKIHLEPISMKIENEKEIRLTIDTLQDFNIVSEIYRQFSSVLNIEELVDLIKENSYWMLNMKNEIINNQK